MIERGDKVRQALQALGAHAARQKVSVIVGYTAFYALYVHEAPMTLQGQPRAHFGRTRAGVAFGGGTGKGRYWDPQGRATNKFLEKPFRSEQKKMYDTVLKVYQTTKSMEYALLIAGLYLQRISMEMVPVDTSNLKQSAFTRAE